MTTVQGCLMVPVRDHVIAVLGLGSIFNWRHRNTKVENGHAERVTLVVIGEGNQRLGLAVDHVLGEEDVVIKSIADNYRNLAGIAGASILGDGRVSLILDPPTLIEMSSRPVAAMANS
jgi:two-component system chemotaxis sensor kinase CheA